MHLLFSIALAVLSVPCPKLHGRKLLRADGQKRASNHTSADAKTFGTHKARRAEPDWIGTGNSTATSLKRASKKNSGENEKSEKIILV